MNRFDRQCFLGNGSEEILHNLCVGIVGLGGGGSHVVQQLAHVGISRFVLIDPDIITLTNLNRLVGGTMADVDAELPKLEIAERVIRSLNREATISKHRCYWQEAADALKDCDVIIGGLDSVRAKDELDSFSRRFLIPYIDMGMDVFSLDPDNFLISGQVVLTGHGQPCLRCLGVVTDDALTKESNNYGAAGSNPQVVWPNGALACGAVGLLMQMVTPWHKNPVVSAYLEYDGNQNTLVKSERHKRLLGRRCTHQDQSAIGDPLFDLRQMLVHPKQACQASKPRATGLEHASAELPWWKKLFQIRFFR